MFKKFILLSNGLVGSGSHGGCAYCDVQCRRPEVVGLMFKKNRM